VKELQADPTTNDFVAIKLWWTVEIWGYRGTMARKSPRWLENVGTTLHWGIELQDVKMVTQILGAKDVDLNAVNWMEGTLLHMVVWKGNINIVRQLLECKDRIRLTEEDKEGRTPVEIAHT
jgi:hypothetical protein